MPAWFIDMESATDTDAKSKGMPPAPRTPPQASRASSPSSALHGVTRPSVEATPTNGLPRSASDRPSARRNARCGARSSPSTVTREGRIGMVLLVLFDDFIDRTILRKSQASCARRAGGFGRRIHDRLQNRIRREAYLAARARLHRVPDLLRGGRNAGQQEGPCRAELLR